MRSNEAYLHHILDEAGFLLRQTRGMTYGQFTKDATLLRASARSFEIIGEASKNISPGFKRKHKEIDWKGMAGMRDILIHRYFEVDWKIIWAVIKEDLPAMKKSVEKALAESA